MSWKRQRVVCHRITYLRMNIWRHLLVSCHILREEIINKLLFNFRTIQTQVLAPWTMLMLPIRINWVQDNRTSKTRAVLAVPSRKTSNRLTFHPSHRIPKEWLIIKVLQRLIQMLAVINSLLRNQVQVFHSLKYLVGSNKEKQWWKCTKVIRSWICSN